jgi:hypothetical protein
MKNKKYSKKAQIDSTLTWTIAVFVILFILMVFLAIVFIMADKKSLTGAGEVTQNDILYSNDPAISEDLFSLLNSEISYDGKTERVMTHVINSSYEFLNISSVSGINSNEITQLHEKQKELALMIVEKGKLICNDFSLLTPFGLINPDYFIVGVEGDKNDYLIRNMDESKYSSTVTYKINYQGKDIKIMYKQLKNCSFGVQNNIIGGQNNV